MNQQQALDIMKQVIVAWPRQEVSSDTIAIYVRVLGDLPYDLTQKALDKLMRQDTPFMPTAGEIRAKVYGVAGFGAPHLDEAITEARDFLRYKGALATWNSSGPRPVRPYIHPVVLKTLVGMGADVEGDWEPWFKNTYRDEVATWRARLLEMDFEDAKQAVEDE